MLHQWWQRCRAATTQPSFCNVSFSIGQGWATPPGGNAATRGGGGGYCCSQGLTSAFLASASAANSRTGQPSAVSWASHGVRGKSEFHSIRWLRLQFGSPGIFPGSGTFENLFTRTGCFPTFELVGNPEEVLVNECGAEIMKARPKSPQNPKTQNGHKNK